MSPLTHLRCPLVLDVSSVLNMEDRSCTEAVLRILSVPCLLTVDARIELDSLQVGMQLQPPLIEMLEMGTEKEAAQLVALAAQRLSNADAASVVAALSHQRALVTDDSHLHKVAVQIAPSLRVFSSLDLIEYWRKWHSPVKGVQVPPSDPHR